MHAGGALAARPAAGENRRMSPSRIAPSLLAAALALGVAAASASEPVDNCATMLGSIAVELRYARALPPGKATTYLCPKRTQPLIGASRERILRSLGPPDGHGAGGSDGSSWSYVFAGSHGARGPGTPELVFSFDEDWQVRAIDCHRLP
jgi:hypothetical protein